MQADTPSGVTAGKSQPEVLRDRTKAFAIRVVKLYQSLKARDEARTLGKQVLRSGTSVAANSCCLSRPLQSRVPR
jgi:hypothetical protein